MTSNTTNNLLKCIECGGEVSSRARECPHCKLNPRPMTCLLCLQALKASEQINRMHKACFDKHIKESQDIREDFACPSCQRVFFYKDRQQLSAGCPHCGDPFEVDDCLLCGHPTVCTSRFVHVGPHEPYHRSCQGVLQKYNRVRFSTQTHTPPTKKPGIIWSIIRSFTRPKYQYRQLDQYRKPRK